MSKHGYIPKAVIRTPEDLGHILKQARLREDMTQTELGKAVQAHQRLISRIESGNKGGVVRTIFRILAALNLEIEVRRRTEGTAEDIENMFL